MLSALIGHCEAFFKPRQSLTDKGRIFVKAQMVYLGYCEKSKDCHSAFTLLAYASASHPIAIG